MMGLPLSQQELCLVPIPTNIVPLKPCKIRLAKKYLSSPACYPDVTVIHVPRCDKYGMHKSMDNSRGFELSRAARRVIIKLKNN